MLNALRRRAPIERAADTAGPFWSSPQFNSTRSLGGARNPLALPAFYRGLMLRTGILSTLPLVPIVDGHPAGVPIQLLDQPDPTEDRQTTIARMAASLVLRGEYIAVLHAFDDDGYPQALKVVDPAQATLEPAGTWLIGGRRFPASEVLHCVPLALPGETRGISVVELFRRTITAELAAAEYQGNFYLDGGQPTTVLLNSDPDVTQAELEAMLARYMSKVAAGRREPIALPSYIEVKPLALSNSDAQFLESRQFATTDLANIVGVPAYFIGAPGSSTVYSNLTDQRRDLIDVYLRSDLVAIERGFSRLLPAGLTATFDPADFVRLDPKAQADTLMVEANWRTLNEVRAKAGLEPIEGGDVIASRYQPGSTAPAPASQE